MAEEKTCSNCKYYEYNAEELPCCICKNTSRPYSSEYAQRELMWQPIDNVNHPSHYNQGGIECIDAMVAAFGKEAVENFCLCNAFKYVWRNRDKNGFEDIDKAIWYLNKVKELCSNE